MKKIEGRSWLRLKLTKLKSFHEHLRSPTFKSVPGKKKIQQEQQQRLVFYKLASTDVAAAKNTNKKL